MRFSGHFLAAGLLATAVSAVGCGGGAGTTSAPAIPGPASAAPSAHPAQAAAQLTLSLPLVTPSTAYRSAKFLSASTQSVRITPLSVDGSTIAGATVTIANVGATQPGCSLTSGTISCTISTTLPVGNVVMSLQSYDGQNGTGTLLGTANNVTATIADNARNTLAVTLNGVVANIALFVASPSLAMSSTPAQTRVYIVPLDASGAQIVLPGNYDKSIVLTSSDPRVTFVANGGSASASVTVTSPADQILAVFSGTGTSNAATITATAQAIAPATPPPTAIVGSAPLFLGTPAVSGSVLAGSTVVGLAAINQTAVITPSGGSPPYLAASSNTAVATVSVAAPFTVTARGFGTATITVNDNGGGRFTVPVSVVPPAIVVTASPSAFQVNGSCCTYTLTQGQVQPFAISGGTGTYTLTSLTPTIALIQGSNPYTLTGLAAGTGFVQIASGPLTTYLQATVTATPTPIPAPLATPPQNTASQVTAAGTVTSSGALSLGATLGSGASAGLAVGFAFSAGPSAAGIPAQVTVALAPPPGVPAPQAARRSPQTTGPSPAPTHIPLAYLDFATAATLTTTSPGTMSFVVPGATGTYYLSTYAPNGVGWAYNILGPAIADTTNTVSFAYPPAGSIYLPGQTYVYLLTASPVSSLAVAPAFLQMYGLGVFNTQTLVVEELGFAGTFSATSSCGSVAGLSAASGSGPIWILQVTPTAAGSCSIVVSDGAQQTTVPISVTLNTITIQPNPSPTPTGP